MGTTERLAERSRALEGAAWMVLSTALLACANSLVRLLSAEMHAFQIGFLTNLAALVLVWPRIVRPPERREVPGRARAYLIAAFCGGFSSLSWFYALSRLPLAEATAVTFTAPLIVTALAGILFRERVRPRRWLAIFVGFAGALLVVRPGAAPLDLGTIAVIIATFGMAGGYLMTKILAKLDTMTRIAAILTGIQTGLVLLPALAVWRWPSLSMVPWILVMAASMYLGRMTMIRALGQAPAAVVMPLDFLRLPFIGAIGFFAFGEVPGLVALLGALVIAVASLAILRDEFGPTRPPSAA